MKTGPTTPPRMSWRERLRQLLRPRPRMSLWPATLLASLLLVHGVLAFSASPVAPRALSPASVVSSVAQQAKLVYAEGARVATQLRLIYDIRSFLAEKDKEGRASSVEAGAAETNPCTLSATGLNQAWKR